jgi:hypothetical protein
MSSYTPRLARIAAAVAIVFATPFVALPVRGAEHCVSGSIGSGCTKESPGDVAASFPVSTDGSDPKRWDPKREGRLVAPADHKVLLDNDGLRVTWVSVHAGAQQPLLHYLLPAILIAEPGSSLGQLALRDAQGKPMPPGFVDSMEAPLIAVQPPQAPHTVSNTGAKDNHLLRVEFKRGIPKLLHPKWTPATMPISTDGSDPKTWAAAMDGPVAAAASHKVIFESAALRVQAVTVPAQGEEVFHNHPYPAILINYQPSPHEMDRSASGKTFDLSSFAALAPYVLLQAPEAQHSVKNFSSTPAYLLRVEFKQGFTPQ